MRDEIPTPPLQQLHRPINTPRINQRDRKRRRPDRQLDPARQRQALHFLRAQQHQHEEGDEHGDGGHLEDDAADHDVGAGFWVPDAGLEGGGGEAAADALHDDGDDVAGAEDPEVEGGGEGRGVVPEDGDQLAEDDVAAGGEEAGG